MLGVIAEVDLFKATSQVFTLIGTFETTSKAIPQCRNKKDNKGRGHHDMETTNLHSFEHPCQHLHPGEASCYLDVPGMKF